MEHIFALFLMFHGGAPAAVVPANSFLCRQIEVRVAAGQHVALNVGLPATTEDGEAVTVELPVPIRFARCMRINACPDNGEQLALLNLNERTYP